ncbi:phosphatase PAP2 family protein [Methylomonas paludis]|uniref:undecaprenyl-diphosphate phosphatase n=1 Tax=Methylomonas paludis TaxID=1173101 RepID=A0A975MPA4_9GAMM|nr:phosphatase PAP2 family protein [Methylomonas paludis]QWF71295.1 phosphatase PAP2 family protein [Methylomonas paludis]
MKLIYSIHKYDVFMFTWLNSVSIHANLVRICRYISKTGDGLLYVALAACLLWYQGASDPLLQAMVLAFSIERPLYFLLKNSCKRHRPQQALQNFRSVITPSDQFSFPSGHTSAACMVACLIAYFYPGLLPILAVWAALVGFSRVVLGVHFPTDTLVGAGLGLGSAIFSLNQIVI